jgi:hypothetical protein
MSIMKSRQQEFSQKAHEEHRRCCDWLLRFMKNKHPKFLTKSELRAAAIRKFSLHGSTPSRKLAVTIGMNRYADECGPKVKLEVSDPRPG